MSFFGVVTVQVVQISGHARLVEGARAYRLDALPVNAPKGQRGLWGPAVPKRTVEDRRDEYGDPKSPPRIATQVRFTEVGPSEHGGIELSAADVSFPQGGAPQRWPSM
jgi:hypothetical protein